ncbi:hypothetical protein [Paenibacillus hexagrammi]|uniref:Uncharacterized protein n=1 Tax=Paenibacillus hexagrammi TaxID=2908839 RepID=A0ABY3SRP1_9BACL|nr:hypothetical protein [Paenibacillus sp. YPD9-1]UJF35826.1 hypothetical protein L0M14_12525 [Paenibacillus sp. YPD9-1]
MKKHVLSMTVSLLLISCLQSSLVNAKEAAVSQPQVSVSTTDEFVTLQTTTPLFSSPDAGQHVVALLAPQVVQGLATMDHEWYQVHTWLGPLWVNPKVSYPIDVRQEELELKLTKPAIVYEHPNQGARKLGTLAPQNVSVFERGSGWYHIHSDWLGDSWVYAPDPAADPATYTPPVSVEATPVTDASWSEHQYEFGAGWRGFPFATEIYAAGSNEESTPSDMISFGSDVKVEFKIANASEDALTLSDSTKIQVDIKRVDDGDPGKWTPVWSGVLPSLQAAFPKRDSHITSRELTFHWDQKDSNGKQVPFGKYRVELKTPFDIDYTNNRTSEQLQQVTETHMRSAMWMTIAAP